MATGPLLTVGVYGFTSETFLAALTGTDVGLLIDVRQRRGVRGSKYAWANARRLQEAVEDAGIDYLHMPELAPTTELRELQYREDDRQGVGKRSRDRLADAYIERYRAEILEPVDLEPLVAFMPARRGTCLLCVEREPRACHRSLIAERMEAEHGLAARHLVPE
ncbi:MAG: DUF488 domain-containing protein [Solirubrobacterales bacterium]